MDQTSDATDRARPVAVGGDGVPGEHVQRILPTRSLPQAQTQVCAIG